MMSIYIILYWIVVFYLFSTAMTLFLWKTDSPDNRILGFIFLLKFCLIIFYILRSMYAIELFRTRFFLGIDFLLSFILFPVVYQLIRSLISGKRSSSSVYLPHCIPGILSFLVIQLFPGAYFHEMIGVQICLIYLQGFLYLGLSFREVYADRQDSSISEFDKKQRRWTRIIMIGMGILLANGLITTVLPDYDDSSDMLYSFVFELLFLGLITVWTFVILKGKIDLAILPGSNSRPVKYSKSVLTEESKQNIMQQLDLTLIEKKLYLDPSLTIQKLSGITGIHPRDISQVVNEKSNVNFNEFLNTYRIKESLRQLRDPVLKNKTMLYILFECGFNSKSSFNRTFKKMTGKTPKEYRDE